MGIKNNIPLKSRKYFNYRSFASSDGSMQFEKQLTKQCKKGNASYYCER